jgi:hypothetical protein
MLNTFKQICMLHNRILAIALEGEHGVEGAYAALRVEGKPVGAPDRSPSYPVNPWEYLVAESKSHYTYYIPLSKEMEGKRIEMVVLGMKGGNPDFKPAAYLTCYPEPYLRKELKLYPATRVKVTVQPD